MMKKLLTIFAASLAFVACQEEADIPPLAFTDPFVEFNAATRSNVDVDGIYGIVEGVGGGAAATATLTVTTPFGALNEDITVTYTITGTATATTDYTVGVGDLTGGTFVLENRPDTSEDNGNPLSTFDSYDIPFTFPGDGVEEDTKTLTVSLSAVTASGVQLEGRQGPGFGEITFNIFDADCGFAAGDYDVNGTILVDDFGSGPFNSTELVLSSNCPDGTSYNLSDITGGLYTGTYAANYGTSARAAVIAIDETTGAVTWEGVSDQFGGTIIEDPAAASASNYNSTTGVITINWTATAFGERGVTTYTPQ